MLYENDNELLQVDEHSAAAPVVGALPASLAMSQRCAAMLRAYLRENNLEHWKVFHCSDHDLWDIDRHLDELGESEAAWEPMPAMVGGGEPIATMTFGSNSARIWEGGVLHLPRHQVVIARWYWTNPENYSQVYSLWLHASPSAQNFFDMRQKLVQRRRVRATGVWQIVRGYASSDGPRTDRVRPDDLFLTDDVQRRIDMELVRFFSDDVARLYQALKVPYRRGVLLHGPPGNGKTSLIRHVGALLEQIPAMILRPPEGFDSDDLEEVVRRWTSQAPAILVIEDLNWLLEHVNVSTFLNLLDGIESTVTGGLLLIATSNHPQELDPAINNRPGRFDVVIEIPSPAKTLRAQFLARKLPDVDGALIDRMAAGTDGLSFAHLHEVLRLSGLAAIHDGRSHRSEKDLLDAMEAVRRTNEDAVRGFPSKPEIPFGFLPILQRNR